MSDILLPDGLITLIKSAIRAQVAACAVPGSTGPERVEQLTGYSRGTISRWQGDAYKDLPPLDVIFQLEFVTQKPIVSRALASLTSHRLVPLADDAGATDLVGDLVKTTSTGARVSSELGSALADGVVTPREAKAVKAAIGEHLDALTSVQRKLAGLPGKGE